MNKGSSKGALALLTSEKEILTFKHIFQHSLRFVITVDNDKEDEQLKNLTSESAMAQHSVRSFRYYQKEAYVKLKAPCEELRNHA